MQFVLPANGGGVLSAIRQYMETMEQSAAELMQQANLTPYQTSQLCVFLVNVRGLHQALILTLREHCNCSFVARRSGYKRVTACNHFLRWFGIFLTFQTVDHLIGNALDS